MYTNFSETEICWLCIVLRKVNTNFLTWKILSSYFENLKSQIINKRMKEFWKICTNILETGICWFRIGLRKVKTQPFTWKTFWKKTFVRRGQDGRRVQRLMDKDGQDGRRGRATFMSARTKFWHDPLPTRLNFAFTQSLHKLSIHSAYFQNLKLCLDDIRVLL